MQQEQSSEEKRKQHQKELAIAMNEAAKERLASQKDNSGDTKVRKSNISYKSASYIPKEPQVTGLKLYVGQFLGHLYSIVSLKPFRSLACPFIQAVYC